MQALDCPSLAVARTKKMTCTFIVQVFFCKGVRDLNGTLRKQHSALFLVPGVSTVNYIKLISNLLNRYNSFLILLTLFQ